MGFVDKVGSGNGQNRISKVKEPSDNHGTINISIVVAIVEVILIIIGNLDAESVLNLR